MHMEISELQVPFQARNLMIRITWGREKEIEKVVLRIRVFMYLQLWALNLLVKIPYTNEKIGCSCGVCMEVHTWIKLYENRIFGPYRIWYSLQFNFDLEIFTEAAPLKCQNFVTRLHARKLKAQKRPIYEFKQVYFVALYVILSLCILCRHIKKLRCSCIHS